MGWSGEGTEDEVGAMVFGFCTAAPRSRLLDVAKGWPQLAHPLTFGGFSESHESQTNPTSMRWFLVRQFNRDAPKIAIQ
jgi:hypothetical protein